MAYPRKLQRTVDVRSQCCELPIHYSFVKQLMKAIFDFQRKSSNAQYFELSFLLISPIAKVKWHWQSLDRAK
jgi:hypothetical protein